MITQQKDDLTGCFEARPTFDVTLDALCTPAMALLLDGLRNRRWICHARRLRDQRRRQKKSPEGKGMPVDLFRDLGGEFQKPDHADEQFVFGNKYLGVFATQLPAGSA
jgi:hypothetical protein